MISKYVKEQKRYTQDELRKIFECTADETVQIIRKLKEYGIVKNVKKSAANTTTAITETLSQLVPEKLPSDQLCKLTILESSAKVTQKSVMAEQI